MSSGAKTEFGFDVTDASGLPAGQLRIGSHQTLTHRILPKLGISCSFVAGTQNAERTLSGSWDVGLRHGEVCKNIFPFGLVGVGFDSARLCSGLGDQMQASRTYHAFFMNAGFCCRETFELLDHRDATEPQFAVTMSARIFH